MVVGQGGDGLEPSQHEGEAYDREARGREGRRGKVEQLALSLAPPPSPSHICGVEDAAATVGG